LKGSAHRQLRCGPRVGQDATFHELPAQRACGLEGHVAPHELIEAGHFSTGLDMPASVRPLTEGPAVESEQASRPPGRHCCLASRSDGVIRQRIARSPGTDLRRLLQHRVGSGAWRSRMRELVLAGSGSESWLRSTGEELLDRVLTACAVHGLVDEVRRRGAALDSELR
jgi:hypothetical protein